MQPPSFRSILMLSIPMAFDLVSALKCDKLHDDNMPKHAANLCMVSPSLESN